MNSRVAEGIASAFVPGMAQAVRVREAEDRLLVKAHTLGLDGDMLIEKARHRYVASPHPSWRYDYTDALDEVFYEAARL